jgi:hypothetical protein
LLAKDKKICCLKYLLSLGQSLFKTPKMPASLQILADSDQYPHRALFCLCRLRQMPHLFSKNKSLKESGRLKSKAQKINI